MLGSTVGVFEPSAPFVLTVALASSALRSFGLISAVKRGSSSLGDVKLMQARNTTGFIGGTCSKRMREKRGYVTEREKRAGRFLGVLPRLLISVFFRSIVTIMISLTPSF